MFKVLGLRLPGPNEFEGKYIHEKYETLEKAFARFKREAKRKDLVYVKLYKEGVLLDSEEAS